VRHAGALPTRCFSLGLWHGTFRPNGVGVIDHLVVGIGHRSPFQGRPAPGGIDDHGCRTRGEPAAYQPFGIGRRCSSAMKQRAGPPGPAEHAGRSRRDPPICRLRWGHVFHWRRPATMRSNWCGPAFHRRPHAAVQHRGQMAVGRPVENRRRTPVDRTVRRPAADAETRSKRRPIDSATISGLVVGGGWPFRWGSPDLVPPHSRRCRGRRARRCRRGKACDPM